MTENINEIDLSDNRLTKLTEYDLKGLCDLKSFKYNELHFLNLRFNYLSDIDFITKNTPFINLKILIISGNNVIKDISNIKYLNNLQYLYISDLHLNSEKKTIKLLKTLKKLKELTCYDILENYDLEKELPGVKIHN